MAKFFRSNAQPFARAPIIAGAAGFFLVLASIIWSAQNFLAFFSLEGLFIVVGGVIAVAFMSFPTTDVKRALAGIIDIFREPSMTHDNLHHEMMEIIGWARIVKEKGMRELEQRIGKKGATDPFVRYGLNMVVSQYAPKDVRSMMVTAADACYERDCVPVDVLSAMTSHAPAFGMVGTLVGMVTMLCSLNDNVSSIGSSLAVSFLSTLYGVLSARMIYMPAAAKLRQEADNRRFRNHLIMEGMVMLVSNKTPMFIQDRLNSFLRPETHDYFNAETVAANNLVAKGPALKPPRVVEKPKLRAVGT